MLLPRDLKGDIDDDNGCNRMTEAIGGGLKPGGHDGALGALVEAVRTGAIGDGKIFVTEVVDVVRIRDDARGESAL